jgi:hypothetical protein
MGKKKICPKCQKEYEPRKKDTLLRRMVETNARLFPSLSTVLETAKEYCPDCWKEIASPAARTLLGQLNDQVEKDEKVKNETCPK